MNRRAVSLIMTAFFLVIAATVIIMMYQVADRYAKEESFSKYVLANDMALFIDTLYAAPGNFYLLYKRPFVTENTDPDQLASAINEIQFKNNEVILHTFKGQFVSSQQLLEARYSKPPQLYLLKQEDRLFLSVREEDLPKSNVRLNCPTAKSPIHISEQVIFLDPQHGGSDVGLATDVIREAIFVGELAQSFCSSTQAISDSVYLSRPHDLSESAFISLDQRKSSTLVCSGEQKEKKLPTLILSFGIGQGAASTQDIIAYIPRGKSMGESQALACNMLNSLAQGYAVTAARIIPIDVTSLDPTDPRAILSPDVPSIAFTLGNIDYVGKQNLLESPATAGNILGTEVMKYLS